MLNLLKRRFLSPIHTKGLNYTQEGRLGQVWRLHRRNYLCTKQRSSRGTRAVVGRSLRLAWSLPNQGVAIGSNMSLSVSIPDEE